MLALRTHIYIYIRQKSATKLRISPPPRQFDGETSTQTLGSIFRELIVFFGMPAAHRAGKQNAATRIRRPVSTRGSQSYLNI